MRETPWGNADVLRSRRLRPGPGTSRHAVAANRRDRLLAAMVALVDERGYPAIRVEDLTSLAGVSRGAYYEQFAGKEECLLAVIDALDGAMTGAVAEALAGAGPPAARVRAALQTQVDRAVAQPAAARLLLVSAYGAGDAASDRAARGTAELVRLLGTAIPLPREAVVGLVGGVRRAVATRLRAGRLDDLPGLVEPLADWALSYPAPPAPLRRPRGETDKPARYAPRGQAERILLGLAEAVAEKGYAAATFADVAARASTSTRTIYANFDSKEDAFAAAADLAGIQAHAAALAAARRAPDWASAVRDGIGALCGFLADEPALARASVVEPYAAGEGALRRHDDALASYVRLLGTAGDGAPELPPLVGELIAGAIDALLYDALRDPRRSPRAVVPAASYLALAPFVGAERACALANGSRRA